MKYFFHPEAAKEYLDAVAYYAGIRPRLAESFIHAVETGIERILASPDTWKIMALHNEAYFYCLRFLGRLAVSAEKVDTK